MRSANHDAQEPTQQCRAHGHRASSSPPVAPSLRQSRIGQYLLRAAPAAPSAPGPVCIWRVSSARHSMLRLSEPATERLYPCNSPPPDAEPCCANACDPGDYVIDPTATDLTSQDAEIAKLPDTQA